MSANMNRLWVRLSIAFSAVVFVAIAALALISVAIIRETVAEMDRERAEAGIQSRQMIALSAGEVNDMEKAIPIVIDGATVGYFEENRDPFPQPPGPIRAIGWEHILLLIAVVGGSIGILFGTLMSRTLVAPLNALVTTANEIGAGNWASRVTVKGTAETRSLAQSFNTMVDQLQRNESLRRNMVADIAHELRTPITALQANIYAILDDAYPMTKEEIAGLYEQTRMLSRLVQDLHELSQAESGQLALDRHAENLGDTLAEMIAPFRSVAESKNVRLEVEIPPQLPLVLVDEQRINQVMHNLLNNALRHTPSGGTIRIRAFAQKNTLGIEIHDTGEGIPPEHLPNVFERFYRVDYARSRKTGGMGLGLAITKAIVEAHNGSISIASNGIPGEGTTFTIQLPLVRDAV